MHQTFRTVGLHDSLHARAFGVLKSPSVILGAGASPLLRLPTEIRLRIYEFVFTPCKEGDPLGLLRACKRIYYEAYSIALPTLQIRFQRLHQFVEWWLNLEPGLKPKVKHLKLAARFPAGLHEIPAGLMRHCTNLRLQVLTLVFEEETVAWNWIEARTTGIWNIIKTMNHIGITDVVHVMNKRAANTPHLLAIFATLRECAQGSDTQPPEECQFVYGFMEEDSSNVVNPGYRMVRRAQLGKVLDTRGMEAKDPETYFLEESQRVFERYPEPPVRHIQGGGGLVMFNADIDSVHHFH
ncbi:hypothetical protein K491DRAFT_712151 [Lophiostoma macrostomum CBS 122681]|uniref:Uncharacterized protein n=1 Tax=Lophiostoma macrostomum CBS 122681 TaxID=1314788 RepID=A0A6A6TKZ4_9PLEO|nr:hypothetical protein K491DRAFT_712151 [Lophiostoma macrostomum CBS 122681]